MGAKMTLQRATEFGAAWNSRDADKVASYFAEDGEYHASFGPELFGASYVGRDAVRRGVEAFFARFPDGKFEDLQVFVAGDRGTFEWTFVARNADGKLVATHGCDLLEFVGDMVKKKNAFRKQRVAAWRQPPLGRVPPRRDTRAGRSARQPVARGS
jgi:ketosteroid isomerase-like protein